MEYLSRPSITFEGCARRIFNKGERHITRTCDFSVLILMFGGVLRFYEDGKPISLSQGEYYIQKQGLFQEGREESDTPDYFYIHFKGSFTADERKSGALPVRGRFSASEVLPLIRRFERVYFSPVQNVYTLNGLFYGILGTLNQKPLPKDKTALAEEMENYIFMHCCACDFSLNRLVKRFGYSADYLIRIFKERFKKTPHSYLKQLRIEHAKQLMLSTNRNIGVIAQDSGYADYSVFYKAFLQETKKARRHGCGNKN